MERRPTSPEEYLVPTASLVWLAEACRETKLHHPLLDSLDAVSFVSWKACSELIAYFAKYTEGDALYQLGYRAWHHFPLRQARIANTQSGEQLLKNVFGVNGLLAKLFPVSLEAETKSPGRVSISIKLRNDLVSSSQFLLVLRGMLAAAIEITRATCEKEGDIFVICPQTPQQAAGEFEAAEELGNLLKAHVSVLADVPSKMAHETPRAKQPPADMVREPSPVTADDLSLATTQRTNLVGNVSRGISHDFKNLLAAIRAIVEQGDFSSLDPDLQVELDNAVTFGDDLVTHLLQFVASEDRTYTPIDLSALLQRQCQFVRRLLTEDISFVTHVDPDLFVNGNATQLQQVFMNLVVNARDAIEGNGMLRLDVRRHDDDVKILVADSGVGIPPANLSRIFDPLFTTKDKGQGTGIGLALVADIVGNHGGEISVDSSPGHGTTFTIRLNILKANTPRRAGELSRDASPTRQPGQPSSPGHPQDQAGSDHLR